MYGDRRVPYAHVDVEIHEAYGAPELARHCLLLLLIAGPAVHVRVKEGFVCAC
jgi:hypothetical protein